MEVVGYAFINLHAQSGKSAGDLADFRGKISRVLEFATDGSVLLLNDKGNALASFDQEDIKQKFECTVMLDVICPTGLSNRDKVLYWARCSGRKGGYNHLLKQMLIIMSLRRGEFDDRFLWSKP